MNYREDAMMLGCMAIFLGLSWWSAYQAFDTAQIVLKVILLLFVFAVLLGLCAWLIGCVIVVGSKVYRKMFR